MKRAHQGPAGPTLLGDVDLHLFNEGTHDRLDEHLGSHPVEVEVDEGEHRAVRRGTWFGVWAPNAEMVSIIGDWNGWNDQATPMAARGSSGIWERFVPDVGTGARYRYAIRSRHGGRRLEKIDPFAVHHATPPARESIVWDPAYEWGDQAWMQSRAERQAQGAPISIYELHLASWRRIPEQGDRPLSYRELAPLLIDHVRRLGFTHVELMPVMEHPFGGSWGYQVTGYFAPTSRFGTPQEFMFLVDQLHQAGIGVILDWVPAHFPDDEHALADFDGTGLYEHADPRQGRHPDWGSAIFNYGRHEVKAFLTSSATSWLRRFHADGLRVDGVASMLYLDYSRNPGEWIPNRWGGRENVDAIDLLRQVNETVRVHHPGTLTIAEESTAWPMVTRPAWLGGLGFDYKWDMGWMHDTLRYLSRDPIHRRWHHNDLTFRGMYAFSEAFVLPLSHDEVVHGKGSLLGKMAGDEWQKLANLRLLYAWMWAQPGKKLLFMGGELGQWGEWNHDRSLDWHLLGDERHARIMLLIGILNRLYREEPAMARLDCEPAGFEWLEADDADHSVCAFVRRAGPAAAGGGGEAARPITCIFNFTPLPRHNYRVAADRPGWFHELLNTDAQELGGSGHGNLGGVWASPVPWKGRPHSLNLTLPPLGAVFLRADGG